MTSSKRFDLFFWCFCAAIILGICVSAHCQVTPVAVTGHLKTASGTAQSQGTYVKVQLAYCGPSQSSVPGVAILPVPASGYFTFKPDSTGFLSFNIYGNDVISCAGTVGNTRWKVSYVVNNQEGPACTQQITGSVWNLDNGNCIEVPPVPTAPTADQTYARLDGSNDLFLGIPIFTQGIEFGGGQMLNPSGFNGTGKLMFDTGADAPSMTIEAFKCTNCNGMAVATQFPGADIGAQVNAAIASLSGGCGEVLIPAGAYTQTTTIVKPRCVKLHGASAMSTLLTWSATSGWAVVVGDNTAPLASYPSGSVEDVSLIGPGSGTAGGIYIGGDPANTISPSSYIGDHQNFNRVRVFTFHVGTQWGNNSWDDTYLESVLTNNDTDVSYPAGLSGSGESLNFIATSIQNATTGINQAGFSDMYFTNVRCDYNTTCGTVGFAHFVNTHFEQHGGVMLTVNSTYQSDVSIVGGTAIFADAVGTDTNMFVVSGTSSPNFSMNNVELLANHTVTNLVGWSASGARPVLYLRLGYHVNFTNDLSTSCTFFACTIFNSAAGTFTSGSNQIFNHSVQIKDEGKCTMTAGACAAQSLSTTYNTAPNCFATWTGTGTLAGKIQIASTTTTVTPSSSTGTDTAQVNWACFGN